MPLSGTAVDEFLSSSVPFRDAVKDLYCSLFAAPSTASASANNSFGARPLGSPPQPATSLLASQRTSQRPTVSVPADDPPLLLKPRSKPTSPASAWIPLGDGVTSAAGDPRGGASSPLITAHPPTAASGKSGGGGGGTTTGSSASDVGVDWKRLAFENAVALERVNRLLRDLFAAYTEGILVLAATFTQPIQKMLDLFHDTVRTFVPEYEFIVSPQMSQQQLSHSDRSDGAVAGSSPRRRKANSSHHSGSAAAVNANFLSASGAAFAANSASILRENSSSFNRSLGAVDRETPDVTFADDKGGRSDHQQAAIAGGDRPPPSRRRASSIFVPADEAYDISVLSKRFVETEANRDDADFVAHLRLKVQQLTAEKADLNAAVIKLENNLRRSQDATSDALGVIAAQHRDICRWFDVLKAHLGGAPPPSLNSSVVFNASSGTAGGSSKPGASGGGGVFRRNMSITAGVSLGGSAEVIEAEVIAVGRRGRRQESIASAPLIQTPPTLSKTADASAPTPLSLGAAIQRRDPASEPPRMFTPPQTFSGPNSPSVHHHPPATVVTMDKVDAAYLDAFAGHGMAFIWRALMTVFMREYDKATPPTAAPPPPHNGAQVTSGDVPLSQSGERGDAAHNPATGANNDAIRAFLYAVHAEVIAFLSDPDVAANQLALRSRTTPLRSEYIAACLQARVKPNSGVLRWLAADSTAAAPSSDKQAADTSSGHPATTISRAQRCDQTAVVIAAPDSARLNTDNFSSITRVDFSYLLIGDHGVLTLVPVLHRLYKLRWLNLAHNGIKNTGLRELVQHCLLTHPSITHLDLSGNLISKDGGKDLLLLVTRNLNLATLVLEGTKIDSSFIAKILQPLNERRKQQVVC